jgi:hypothetical protein
MNLTDSQTRPSPSGSLTKTPNEEITVKVYGEISESLYEKLLNYCFWEHETQGETVAATLEQFLAEKDIKSRPDKVKNRT